MVIEDTNVNELDRLIATENSMSDLLAFLIGMDSSVVSKAFGLDIDESLVGERESSTHGRGRLDLVIRGEVSARPYAAVEMKGASSIHGAQLERYSVWALEFGQHPPKLIYCAFGSDEIAVGAAWTKLRIRDVFAAWQHSKHVHAAWLANNIVRILDQWDLEADGCLGESTGYYINDIVTKRIVRDLGQYLSESPIPLETLATRDNGGNPMLFAWTVHPQFPTDSSVSVGVDLRTEPRRLNRGNWKLRPHVEVGTHDLAGANLRSKREAQRLAFELASKIRVEMGLGFLSTTMNQKGLGHLVHGLSGGKHDGFKKDIFETDFDEWKRLMQEEEDYPGAGPFGSDRGLRLATILSLDVTSMTRKDIAILVSEIVKILHSAASRENG